MMKFKTTLFSLPGYTFLKTLFITLPLLLIAPVTLAQYDAWTAPRLLAEYRQMLVSMDNIIKTLDKNIALAESLSQEKVDLDQLAAEITEMRIIKEESSTNHNTEVASFNAECIDVPVTNDATGEHCNDWSNTLNERNSELTSRQETLSNLVNEYNTRVDRYNAEESARAQEAAELDRRYDDDERQSRLIDSTLASKTETRDIYRRCASYSEPETRQGCMQDLWNKEGSSSRPYTRNQSL